MGLFDWFTKPIEDVYRSKKAIDKEYETNQGTTVLETENNTPEKVVVSSTLEPHKSMFRPLSFDQYIGQDKAKTILKAYIRGIKERNDTFPHLLIHGPAGCGKTTLAKIVAKELGVAFKEVISTKIEGAYQILSLISDIDGGVIFLDEVHGLNRRLVEPLYPIMEDFKLWDEHIKKFTLIGATTEVGEIIKTRRPFYDRFKIKQELEDYEVAHMKKIIMQYKERQFPLDELKDSTYDTISRNSRYTPRRAIGLLEATIYLRGDIATALESFSIIEDGYTFKDLKTLELIAQHEKGIGLQALASYLGTSKQNYTYDIEPYLLKHGLILRTARGRKISASGLEVMQKLKEKIGE